MRWEECDSARSALAPQGGEGSSMQTEGFVARFGKVIFPGWKRSLVAIAAGMAVSLLLIGFSMPYWKIADQDLPLAYNGLLLNDGRAQEYFDHTGYLYDLLLAAWYRVLHWA